MLCRQSDVKSCTDKEKAPEQMHCHRMLGCVFINHDNNSYQVVGFPVMQEKVLGLATVLDFLGFIIDTMSMEIRLLLRSCHALSR